MSKDSIHIHTPQKRQQMDGFSFFHNYRQQLIWTNSSLGESLMKHEGVKQSWLSNGGEYVLFTVLCTQTVK